MRRLIIPQMTITPKMGPRMRSICLVSLGFVAEFGLGMELGSSLCADDPVVEPVVGKLALGSRGSAMGDIRTRTDTDRRSGTGR